MNQRHFGGKRGSLRHSTTRFSKNVVVAKTSYHTCQKFCYFAFGRGLNLPQQKLIIVLAFPVKKSTLKSFLGCQFYNNTRKNLEVKSRPRSVVRRRPRPRP